MNLWINEANDCWCWMKTKGIGEARWPSANLFFLFSSLFLMGELKKERLLRPWRPREQSSNQSSTKKNKIILFLFDWLDWFAAVPAESCGIDWFAFSRLLAERLWRAEPHGREPREKTREKSKSIQGVSFLWLMEGMSGVANGIQLINEEISLWVKWMKWNGKRPNGKERHFFGVGWRQWNGMNETPHQAAQGRRGKPRNQPTIHSSWRWIVVAFAEGGPIALLFCGLWVGAGPQGN